MPRISFALEPARQVLGLQSIWTDLESRCDGSFFTSWNWIGPWLSLTQGAPFVLTGRKDGRVVALAMLQAARVRRYGLKRDALFLNQSGDPTEDAVAIEYNSILADREIAPVALEQAIGFLQSAGKAGAPFPRWDELHVAGMCGAIRPRGRERDLIVSSRWRKPTWRVDLDKLRSQQTAYLDTLSANSRYQIRRALKIYGERGPITLTAAAEMGQARDYYDGLKNLHQRYWTGRGQPGAFRSPFFEEFSWALLAHGMSRGSVEIVRVAAGEYDIGYLLNFLHRGNVYSYLSGFRYEANAKLKPGLVSHTLCLERHLTAGAQLYDFLAGNDRYKESLGTCGPTLEYFILQRRTPNAIVEAIGRRIKQNIIGGMPVQGSYPSRSNSRRQKPYTISF